MCACGLKTQVHCPWQVASFPWVLVPLGGKYFWFHFPLANHRTYSFHKVLNKRFRILRDRHLLGGLFWLRVLISQMVVLAAYCWGSSLPEESWGPFLVFGGQQNVDRAGIVVKEGTVDCSNPAFSFLFKVIYSTGSQSYRDLIISAVKLPFSFQTVSSYIN